MAPKNAHELLETTLVELFQADRDAHRRSRLEAERLGQSPPGTAMDELAIHTERSLEQLGDLARHRGVPPPGGSVVRAASVFGERITSLATTAERSYRRTLLGARRSVDLVRLLRELAVAADDRDLRDWSERWSFERIDLIEQAEAALAWFAEYPHRAMEPLKNTLVAHMTRTLLKAAARADTRVLRRLAEPPA